MLSSWAALGTGASEGLTGRSTSGCPGWAYTGLGSKQKTNKTNTNKLTIWKQTLDEQHHTFFETKETSPRPCHNLTPLQMHMFNWEHVHNCHIPLTQSHTHTCEAHSVLSREVRQKGSRVLQAAEERHTRSSHTVYFHLAPGKASQAQQASGSNCFWSCF